VLSNGVSKGVTTPKRGAHGTGLRFSPIGRLKGVPVRAAGHGNSAPTGGGEAPYDPSRRGSGQKPVGERLLYWVGATARSPSTEFYWSSRTIADRALNMAARCDPPRIRSVTASQANRTTTAVAAARRQMLKLAFAKKHTEGSKFIFERA
jgi:hypothetical protein